MTAAIPGARQIVQEIHQIGLRVTLIRPDDEARRAAYEEACLLAEDELETEIFAAQERYQHRRNEAAKILNGHGEN